MGYYTCEGCDTDVPGVHEGHDQWPNQPPELCPPCTEIRDLKTRILRAYDLGSSNYSGSSTKVVEEMLLILQGRK